MKIYQIILLQAIFLTTLFSLHQPAYAQIGSYEPGINQENPTGRNNSRVPLKLGLKIAPNLAWMNPSTKDYSSDGVRLGTTIGLVGDIYFADQYAISTGFNFIFLNGKLSYRDSRLIHDDTVVNGQVSRKYNFLYLEIPVMIKMSTRKFGRFSFFGQVGLGTGFRVKATVKEHFEPDSGEPLDQKYDYDSGTTLIRESILVGIGSQYHLDKSTMLFFGMNYSNSLNNILTGVNSLSKSNEKSMFNYVELNLGVLF